MKNLDLNSFGVQEMNAGEMRENNGGFWWIVGVVVAGLVYDIISNPSEAAASCKAGWNSVQ